jgi:hypothetical protein
VSQAAVPQADVLDLNPRQIRAMELLARESRLTIELYRQWKCVSCATAQRDQSGRVARGLLRQQRGVGRVRAMSSPALVRRERPLVRRKMRRKQVDHPIEVLHLPVRAGARLPAR